MNIRYGIGTLLKNLGYHVRPEWKMPKGTMHPLDLAGAVLMARNGGRIGAILQIGVFDGVQNDPLAGKLLSSAESVTMVEPQPAAVAALRRRFDGDARVRIIEAAVTNQPGEVLLYSPSEYSPRASLIREHGDRFGHREHPNVTSVRGITPVDLIQEIGKVPDLLQVDAEGMDWIIVKSLLFGGVLPLVVNFENLHLRRPERLESRAVLTQYGYQFTEYELDTCAVQQNLFNEISK